MLPKRLSEFNPKRDSQLDSISYLLLRTRSCIFGAQQKVKSTFWLGAWLYRARLSVLKQTWLLKQIHKVVPWLSCQAVSLKCSLHECVKKWKTVNFLNCLKKSGHLSKLQFFRFCFVFTSLLRWLSCGQTVDMGKSRSWWQRTLLPEECKNDQV